jgi:hypothetical protein
MLLFVANAELRAAFPFLCHVGDCTEAYVILIGYQLP